MVDTEKTTVSFFKKGKSRPTTTRKRDQSPPAPSSTTNNPSRSSEGSQVVLPSRKAPSSLLGAGTKRTFSKRDGQTNNYDDGDADEREGPDVKWTASGSHQQVAQEILDGDEAEELLERQRKRSRPDEDEDEAPRDGLYRGQKAYKAHLKKSEDTPKAMRVGPQRATGSTIRTVTITDYQPDVCKDYKETGFCGFGDTCKFLHDRGTYMAGWQLDQLAAKQQGADVQESDSDSDNEDVPFACLICRKPYTDPVVTRCGHYFCSACAIKRFARTPKCIVCGAPTAGIFNRADKVLEKLKKQQEKEEEGKDDEKEVGDLELEGLRDDGAHIDVSDED